MKAGRKVGKVFLFTQERCSNRPVSIDKDPNVAIIQRGKVNKFKGYLKKKIKISKSIKIKRKENYFFAREKREEKKKRKRIL